MEEGTVPRVFEDDDEVPELRPCIIGLVGKTKAGKTSIADFLVNVLGFKRLSFGESVKKEVARGFGMEPSSLIALEKREGKQINDLYHSWRIGRQKLSGKNYWVKQLLEQLPYHPNVVIDDIHYPDELIAVAKAGGRIGKLELAPKTQIERGADETIMKHESQIALDTYIYNPAFIIETDAVDFDTVRDFVCYWMAEEGYLV